MAFAFEVEDGSGIADATSYVSENDADAYAEGVNNTAWAAGTSANKEAALVRASTAIDARYGASFPGYRAHGREQGLEWPRAAAYDAAGWLIADDIVPVEVVKATIEAAFRELANPGSMMPDLARGGAIQSVTAGSVSVTWSGNAAAKTAYTLIDGIIAPILNTATGSGGGLFGVAVRG